MVHSKFTEELNMKRYLLLSLIFITALAPAHAAKVVLFYGKLKPIQASTLERVFIEKAKKSFSKYPNTTFEIIKKSGLQSLLRAFKDPEVIGILYFGHPALVTEGVVNAQEDRRVILNGFLQTADGKYIPKSILSSAHKKLQFVSFMTCHQSVVLEKYLRHLKEGTRFYRAPETNSAGGENPLFEFTSYYNTPKILDQITLDFDKHLENFKNADIQTNREKIELEISTRDLLSSRFSYEVLIDDQLVGIIESQKNKRGRKLNTVNSKIEVYKHGELTIRQDDLNRTPKNNQKFIIDDIILDSFKVNSEEQLILPIHLGDESSNVYQGIGLSFLRNLIDFEGLAVQKDWRFQL